MSSIPRPYFVLGRLRNTRSRTRTRTRTDVFDYNLRYFVARVVNLSLDKGGSRTRKQRVAMDNIGRSGYTPLVRTIQPSYGTASLFQSCHEPRFDNAGLTYTRTVTAGISVTKGDPSMIFLRQSMCVTGLVVTYAIAVTDLL